MKKLSLNLDELHVESFDTSSGEPDGRGTIQGRVADTENTPDTCEFSCGVTCGDTCPESCGGTCWADCSYGWTCVPSCNDTVCYCTKVVGQYGCPSWRC
jgi:hypothetical protein